ncbi:unnamed protein product, partial [Mesorhabditis belari]|uniref:Uncharacterized protein n=1 Tax=Mesorhabditis belari TaxID=2138241 RepID=A0AAF3FQL3_9BILA
MSRSKVVTGHNPSPYLRRYRIPQLNTVRVHDDPCTPEDEDGKIELIREKMTELAQRSPAQPAACASSTSTEIKSSPSPTISLRGPEHQIYRQNQRSNPPTFSSTNFSSKKPGNSLNEVSRNPPSKPSYLQFEVSNLRWKNGFV